MRYPSNQVYKKMRYFLYRIQKEDFQEMTEYDNIPIDYTPEEIKEDDKIIVFVSETLNILGDYKTENNILRVTKKPVKTVNLRDFIGQLSFVTTAGPRAYKTFAKKTREITQEDYEKIK